MEVQGTFNELINSKIDFTKLLMAAENQEDTDPKPEKLIRQESIRIRQRRQSVLSCASLSVNYFSIFFSLINLQSNCRVRCRIILMKKRQQNQKIQYTGSTQELVVIFVFYSDYF